MYYSFASPFAALGSAGATRSPARPTEGASTFPLDLSSKTPPLTAVPSLSSLPCPLTAARDLLDQQQRALAASMLGSAFSEWAPGLATSAAPDLKAASAFDSRTAPLGANQLPAASSSSSNSSSNSTNGTSSAFFEQQKQLAALMFSCHALVDPVTMFRARSLQAAFAGASGVSGAGAPSSTQSIVLGSANNPFAAPVYPLADPLWSTRSFESALPRADEASSLKPHIVSQPVPLKSSTQVQAQQLPAAAPKAPVKSEKTFQPWKDDVGCPTPTKPSKPKKTPFNIEALSKPDDSTMAVAAAGDCATVKDDEAKDFKFSLHPKKRRLASPDIPEEACQSIGGMTNMKPKKRAVQVLQKWEDPVPGPSTGSNSLQPLQTLPCQQQPTVVVAAPAAAGPVAVAPEEPEPLLHRAARTGNLEMLTFCLERCSDIEVNQRGRNHATALHEAASKGLVAGVRILLERGADPEAATIEGVRPLHEAVAKGHTEVVRLLLSYGADVHSKTLSGESAANIAATKNAHHLRSFLEDYIEDNTFLDEEAAERDEVKHRKPWLFKGTSLCTDSSPGFDALAGAPEFSLLPEIAIRTFRVIRPVGDGGAMQSLTCAHLDELIASTGLTDVDVFLRTIGDEISQQIVFPVDRTMETDAFSRYYNVLTTVRAIRWDEESKRLLSQALSRGQDQHQLQQQQQQQQPQQQQQQQLELHQHGQEQYDKQQQQSDSTTTVAAETTTTTTTTTTSITAATTTPTTTTATTVVSAAATAAKTSGTTTLEERPEATEVAFAQAAANEP